MLKIVKHDEIKDNLGKFVGALVGVTYTDATTQQRSYKEVLLSAKEFAGVPTKAEIKEKVTQWLTNVPTFEYRLPDGTTKIANGQSVLQIMKEEAGKIPNTTVSLKEGTPESLIGETVVV